MYSIDYRDFISRHSIGTPYHPCDQDARLPSLRRKAHRSRCLSSMQWFQNMSCHIKRLPSDSSFMRRTSPESPSPVIVRKPEPSIASSATRPCPLSCTLNWQARPSKFSLPLFTPHNMPCGLAHKWSPLAKLVRVMTLPTGRFAERSANGSSILKLSKSAYPPCLLPLPPNNKAY